MIKIEHLHKYYNKGKSNENHVINDLSLEFPDTGLVVFFGPSGCGKTTLLNIIGCLDTFDAGSISFLNTTFNKYQAKTFDALRNHLIGYIFQNYNLIESKSVYDNVMVPLEMLGINDKAQIEQRVNYALEAVGMAKYRRRNVLALSGGQRQRVAIARAIAKNPKVIIADEPTGNLDSDNTFEVMNIIKKISKERLVILVSHEKNLVDFYADRIIELKDGLVTSDSMNSDNKDLNHVDKRNIYLKDYESTSLSSDKVKVNIYNDKKNDALFEADIIFKDGQVYIKEKTNIKVQYIDSSSEIKLLDASEEEFKKDIIENVTTFNLDALGDISKETKKNGYIPLTTSILDGFIPKRRFSKRGVFTYIALIFASLVLASVVINLTKTFNVTREEYLTTSTSTVTVSLKKKDEKNGYSIENVINDAKLVDGFLYSSDKDMVYLYVNFSSFYQTNYASTSSTIIYPMDGGLYDYSVIAGRKVQADDEIVLSKWKADELLESTGAIINGWTSYEDLLLLKDDSAYISRFPDNIYLKVVGISNDDSPSAIFSHSMFDSFTQAYTYSNSINIETTNKEKMVEELSKKYSSVIDADKDGRKVYLDAQIESNLSEIIFLGVVAIAIFLYLSLLIRSSMFKKIKDIGVLRSIGARKKDIISIFVGEMISLTTVSSFIGYSLYFALILYMNKAFNFDALGMPLGEVNILNYLGGVIILYLFNILAGTIPVLILMRKTPVEIIKKYDI